MNITRGGYVLINLDDYVFEISMAVGEIPVKVEEDIISLIKYAYAVGKPVCVNNIHRILEDSERRLYTTAYGTVTPNNTGSAEYTYRIPYLDVDINHNTLVWRGE